MLNTSAKIVRSVRMPCSIAACRSLLTSFVLLSVVLALVPGCGWFSGSGSSASAKAKQKGEKDEKGDEAEELIKKRTKQREKPKDDFEPLAVRMLPSNDPSPAIKQPQIHVKPGHWTAVSETAKTNNFDFPGELATFVERQATNQPLELEDKVSRLAVWCPAILPKGQSKRIEGMFYVPRVEAGMGGVYSIRSELHGIRGGRTEVFNTTIAHSLKDYEHLIVVLASGSVTPAAYVHFDKLLAVRLPQVQAVIDPDGKTDQLRYYHVRRPNVDRSAPLPSHPLAWTTIAYLFWDDLDPAVLTNQQQLALLDWLHWGGQLIISGPNSIDKLKGSFLAPYLPGEGTQTVKLDQAAFDELNQRFSLERDPRRIPPEKNTGKADPARRIRVIAERPMLGIDLQLHAAAQPIEGTGGLVVERRVGGGRVVITRFPLTDVRLKQWKNFDGFFNTVLLRRPGRVFSERGADKEPCVDWEDPNLRPLRLDPRVGSMLRYFTRDIAPLDERRATQPVATASADGNRMPGRATAVTPALPPPKTATSNAPVYGSPGLSTSPRAPGQEETDFRIDTSESNPETDDWHLGGYRSSNPLGVAAWDDDGAASQAARQVLTEAAGIEIPSAKFVLQVLGIYLLVLVPLNWSIFWLLGKVEWAWIAAPLIAIVGAGAVIRLAQLDIGFARSRTEVAVLEMQGDYERAHLTRYTALYSSLSSSYTLAFDEQNAVAIPFPSGPKDISLLSIAQYMDVTLRREKETSLSGVQVSSNSTGMVHSEQMVPLGTSEKTLETLKLVGDAATGFSIRNTTDLTIRDVGVFRRVDGRGDSGPAQIEAAYVAKLEPASSAPLRFGRLPATEVSDTASDEAETRAKALERSRQRQSGNPGQPAEGRVAKLPAAKIYPAVWLEAWDQVPIFAEPGTPTTEHEEATELTKTRIRLTRLARLATERLRLLPGDVRLVGWTDQRLPGMRIRPEAPQNRMYTLVLAHLTRGPLPAVRPDRNVAEDYFSPDYQDPDQDGITPPDPTDNDAPLPPAPNP